jgi:hypothetical protein
MTKPSPFRYFKTSQEIIRLVVMLYVWFPHSLRNVGICYMKVALISAISTARTGHASLPENEKFAEIRRRPRLRP